MESPENGEEIQVALPPTVPGEWEYFEADTPVDAIRVSIDGEEFPAKEGEYALSRWPLPEAAGPRVMVVAGSTAACSRARFGGLGPQALQPVATALRSHGFAAFGLTALHQHLSVDRSEAALSLVCDVEADRHARVTLASRITLDGFPVTETADDFHVRFGETGVVQSLIVPRAQLWWPAGHGRRPLYRLHCRLLAEDGRVLDEWGREFGLREVTAEGGLLFNGSPILLRGWYWRAGPQAGEASLLTRLKASGCNFLRVFAGLESREFYEECGRLGLLVCQELPDAPAAGVAELERLIRSRRGHAALVLWGAAASAADVEVLQDVVATEDPEAAWWSTPSDVRPLLTDTPRDEWQAAQDLRLWAEERRGRSEPAVMPADVRALAVPVIRSAGVAFAPFHVSLHPDEAQPAGPRRSVQVRLHNDGRALELLNVTVRVVDPAGADVHQENLAAEAEAMATTTLGEVEWRVTPQRPGPFLVLAEVIDEEGVTLAESDLSLGAVEAFSALTPDTLVALEVEGEYVRAVNCGRAPALWVRVNSDDPARDVVTGFSLGPGSARMVAAGSLAGLTVSWLNRA